MCRQRWLKCKTSDLAEHASTRQESSNTSDESDESDESDKSGEDTSTSDESDKSVQPRIKPNLPGIEGCVTWSDEHS